MAFLRASLLAMTLLGLASPIAARADSTYERRRLPSVRTAQPPTIDGDVSDPVWAQASRADTFIDRVSGRPAAEQTTAWLLYDETNIYVAFYCKDAQPSAIVGRETVRDSRYNSRSNGEDYVDIRFDPFNSHRSSDSASFSVNPLGTPSASLAGGRAGKLEWKGDWTAAARRVADGWTAEMRIPWAIINYPAGAAKIDIGLNLTRYQHRTQIESVWSNTGPERFLERQGTWLGVEAPRHAFRPALSTLPYVLPGLDRARATLRTGLDARATLTPELTAVGSVNPDFGTIEGAVEGIQFSRSERWVEDRRPFFLEGGDDFWAGDENGYGTLFYPNRIPTFDTGLKLYGKAAPATTVGLLSAMDFGRRYDTVLNVRQDFSATSGMGLFLANKTAQDDDNTVGLLTGHRRVGKFGTALHVGRSGGREAGGGVNELSFTYSDKDHFTNVRWIRVGSRFRDADGYVPFTGWQGFAAYHEWTTPWRHGPLRKFHMEAFSQYDWHLDGSPFRRSQYLEAALETRNDWRFRISGQYTRFDDSTDRSVSAAITRGVSNRFNQIGISVDTGQAADRPMTFIGPWARLRVFGKLDVSYGGSVLCLDGHSQQHIATFTYEFSPVRSLGGRVVVWDGNTNWYVSYRNAGARGTDAYVIVGDPNAPRFREQVAMKLVFSI